MRDIRGLQLGGDQDDRAGLLPAVAGCLGSRNAQVARRAPVAATGGRKAARSAFVVVITPPGLSSVSRPARCLVAVPPRPQLCGPAASDYLKDTHVKICVGQSRHWVVVRLWFLS